MSDVETGILVGVQMNDLAFELRVAFVGRLTAGITMDKAVFALLLVKLDQSVDGSFGALELTAARCTEVLPLTTALMTR